MRRPQTITRSVMATESGLVEVQVRSYANKDDFEKAWQLYEGRFFTAIKQSFIHAYDGTSNPNVRSYVVGEEPPPREPDEEERALLYEKHHQVLHDEYELQLKAVAAKLGLKPETVREVHNQMGHFPV